jgi:hypothetical protein
MNNLHTQGPAIITDLDCDQCGRDWHVPLTGIGLRAKPDICPECYEKNHGHASIYKGIAKYGKSPQVKVESDKFVARHVAVVEGTTCVVVTCNDYNHFKKLPEVVSYGNLLLGKTGWNSDTQRCHYQSNVNIVQKVR